ncbi:MAG: nucleotide exchange factor GrpE [Anaerolineae bacterium]|jgi:molecular chaperone GrpE|nr:nucleotide exchange factor GrpE [Anaerolineae bacterium]MDX9831155.1 nucleotide exchange factor GrpE [Anaerolineae bacterium]
MTDQEPDITEKVEQESQEAGEEQVIAGEVLPAEAEEAAPEEALASLRQELEDAQARQAEYLDGWQRARAELANARKRFQREQGQAYDSARADILVRLLPIVDDFQRALENVPEEASNDPWLEGIRLIERNFQHVLEQEGVSAIADAGQEFDPFLHQAVTHEPSDSVPAGHIISALRTGYRMGEQVLRPSMVRVSSGPEAEATPGDDTNDD